ncbi:GH39 family glycosyl hydrolase [Silvibacterium dinghuense]|uniref:Glycoside hydrolase n=1 Tax=Silvibacterium dinghuense TaxID=1560006 RepID=A0A4Q1SHS8_9BACT|nr:glycoside hydrolase [Silvibacterium dinghuense]RXS96935.1 glycoside hydrolase [Silvibacterium dinghuense]GGG94815.1 beta-xylosidase [Silvibacterium dinghuense]
MFLRRIAAFLVLGAPLLAQNPSTPNLSVREIAVDAAHRTGPHSSTPLMTVGAGRANEGLRADWQAQLATVQKEIGFRYLRFHGLLHDDMGVYAEDSAGHAMYNFQYVDALYDALLAQHIRPFVELSFMPAQLASGTKTVFWWKANVTPPKDMEKWNGLIRALMEHWKERYGEEEIARWYFEVWNEPDLDGFWSGTREQYFSLYKNTATEIKTVCAACRVGGPASARWEIEPAWLDFIAKNHVPADFLSTHTYGVVQGSFDADGHAGTVLDTKPDSIVGRVRDSRERIAHSATPQLELHYTEWSTSYTPADPIHDQYISAPFILEKLKAASPFAQSMSYWTFTDIFEEAGPRFTPFHGGFGLMNYEGIRKPAYFAYKFLAALGPDDVATNDAESWTTRKQDGSVQVLFWSYKAIAPPGKETNQTFYKREQPAQTTAPVALTVKGLKDGLYRMQVFRVGYEQNDAYTAYLHMGSPSQLTRAQVTALQAAASGDPEQTEAIEVNNGSVAERFSMRENDAVLVVLTPE